MKIRNLIVGAIVALNLAACASVTRGTKEVLVIESEPPAAQVAISNGEVCESPCSIKMSRKYGVHVSISKAGYQTLETQVNAEVAGGGSAGMAGNVLVGGLIGGVIDAGNGSMNKFVPNPLQVTLVPLSDGEAAQEAVVKPGESFFFKTYAKTGEKLPFDKKERKELEKQRKKEEKERKKAEREAEKAAEEE